MSKIQQINAIIQAYTSDLSGDYFPHKRSLDEVDAALPKYIVNPKSYEFSDGFIQRIRFPVHVRASSQDNLESEISKLLKIDSDYPDGYEFSETNYPHRIEVRDVDDEFENSLNEFESIVTLEGVWEI